MQQQEEQHQKMSDGLCFWSLSCRFEDEGSGRAAVVKELPDRWSRQSQDGKMTVHRTPRQKTIAHSQLHSRRSKKKQKMMSAIQRHAHKIGPLGQNKETAKARARGRAREHRAPTELPRHTNPNANGL